MNMRNNGNNEINHLISIIVPIYNAERSLKRCLNSLINQTYKNLEIICIDDGSIDLSPLICDEYAQKDKRIKVEHIKNGGVSNARNRALNISTGDYIGFVDSDDYVDIDLYEKLLGEMNKNNASIGISNIIKEDENGNLLEKKTNVAIKNLNREEFFNSLFMNSNILGYSCNKLYSRNIIKNNRFNQDYKMTEDSLFNAQIVDDMEYITCTYVGSIYYHYVQNKIVSRKEVLNPKYSYFKVKIKQVEIAEKNNFNSDLLKAIYCINFAKCKSFVRKKSDIPIIFYEKNKLFKKDISIRSLPLKLAIKFLISKRFSIIYNVNTIINKMDYNYLLK